MKLRYETLLDFFFYLFLIFDIEAPFESLIFNIMNECVSYIEQIENSECLLQFCELFRAPIVYRQLQYNFPYLEY